MKNFNAHEVDEIPTEHQRVSRIFVFKWNNVKSTNIKIYNALKVARALELKTNFDESFLPIPNLYTLRFVSLWHGTSSKTLAQNFTKSSSKAWIYTFGSGCVPMLKKRPQCHWADFLSGWGPHLCCTLQWTKRFVETVQKKFEIHKLGFPTEISDMHLQTYSFETHLFPKKWKEKMIEEYVVSSAYIFSTPLPLRFKLSPLIMVSDAVVIDEYKRPFPKLLYLSRFVRNDICFAVNHMARWASNHNQTLWLHLKEILEYSKRSGFNISYKFEHPFAKKKLLRYMHRVTSRLPMTLQVEEVPWSLFYLGTDIK